MKYNYPYHQSLVYKIFNCAKDKGVYVTLDDSLEIIRKISEFTRGIQQIAYIVGWQHDGHDSKYPDWSVVNPRLKRPGDADARSSMLRLMSEAFQYNAAVSIHINMCDAYENSPLWDLYRKKDLLIRQADGSLAKGGIWGGEQCYLVSKAREWREGQARKRIDGLLELLPLKKAGTVHIDVFTPRSSAYHGVTHEQDVEAMREILHYWHSVGVDVTKEWFHHEFADLVPLVWHCNLSEAGRLKYPPDVCCGGGAACNYRRQEWRMDDPGAGWIRMPDAGCLYEEAWGYSVDNDIMSKDFEKPLMDVFYLRTLPWYFLNRLKIIHHVHTRESYEVHFTESVKTEVRDEGKKFTMRQEDRVLQEDSDIFLPALWRENECIAYSRGGCKREWPLPPAWKGISRVAIHNLFPRADGKVREAKASNGRVTISLEPAQAVYVTPA